LGRHLQEYEVGEIGGDYVKITWQPYVPLGLNLLTGRDYEYGFDERLLEPKVTIPLGGKCSVGILCEAGSINLEGARPMGLLLRNVSSFSPSPTYGERVGDFVGRLLIKDKVDGVESVLLKNILEFIGPVPILVGLSIYD